MKQNVYLTHMFPDYEPPEELRAALSQAAIVAADIDPEQRSVAVAVHAARYIPLRADNFKNCRKIVESLRSLFFTWHMLPPNIFRLYKAVLTFYTAER